MTAIIAIAIAIIWHAVVWSFGYWRGRHALFREFVTGSPETYRALGDAREDFARFAAERSAQQS